MPSPTTANRIPVLSREQRLALVDPRWRGRRVAAAMSGGVDSSVTAVLLAEAGCEVVGITMKLWNYEAVGGDKRRDGACCTVESFIDCRAVADKHGFAHYSLDLTERFERTVIDYFVDEYRRGRTPNPCTVCNIEIKWAALWEKARAIGCEAIATGHYARLETDGNGRTALYRGTDASRDQSYFLWGVPREFFNRTIFPLGTLTKSQVRVLAAEYGLVNAEKPESRDICFVADGDLPRFLQERAGADGVAPTPGPIIGRDGSVLGRHSGFEAYTIGQRRGLGVAVGRPQYVTAIDPQSGVVVIGDDSDLMRRTCRVAAVNWLIDPPSSPLHTLTQIRYRHAASAARVTPQTDGTVQVDFDTPERAITPGQSAVFYDPMTEQVLGGGVIESVGPDGDERLPSHKYSTSGDSSLRSE